MENEADETVTTVPTPDGGARRNWTMCDTRLCTRTLSATITMDRQRDQKHQRRQRSGRGRVPRSLMKVSTHRCLLRSDLPRCPTAARANRIEIGARERMRRLREPYAGARLGRRMRRMQIHSFLARRRAAYDAAPTLDVRLELLEHGLDRPHDERQRHEEQGERHGVLGDAECTPRAVRPVGTAGTHPRRDRRQRERHVDDDAPGGRLLEGVTDQHPGDHAPITMLHGLYQERRRWSARPRP